MIESNRCAVIRICFLVIYTYFLPPTNEVCEGVAGDMHGRGGMHGRWVCMTEGACVAGGACMAGGHAWQGDVHGRRSVHGRGACMADTMRYGDTVKERAVLILL